MEPGTLSTWPSRQLSHVKLTSQCNFYKLIPDANEYGDQPLACNARLMENIRDPEPYEQRRQQAKTAHQPVA